MKNDLEKIQMYLEGLVDSKHKGAEHALEIVDKLITTLATKEAEDDGTSTISDN